MGTSKAPRSAESRATQPGVQDSLSLLEGDDGARWVVAGERGLALLNPLLGVGTVVVPGELDPELERALQRTIHKVTGDIERLAFNTAIAAMKEGAYDYITKPFRPNQLVRTIRTCLGEL